MMSGIVRRSSQLVVVASLMLAPLVLYAQDGPTMVQIDEVRSEPLSQTAPVLGRIVTERAGDVAAKVEGPVEAIEVRVGDRVDAGDPLVLLSGDRVQHERDLAEAEYQAALAEQATARAELDKLHDERDRLGQLQTSAAFSRAQFDDKVNEIAVQESRIEAVTARLGLYLARLGLASTDLEDTVIRAPYAGVVTAKHVSPGDWVETGEPVVSLIDDLALEIEADVPSERVSGLVTGIEVAFTVEGGAPEAATVRAVVPAENPMTRTRAVRFEADFAKDDRPLAIEQSVTLLVPIGVEREVLTVHKDAVLQRQGVPMVFVVEEGIADLRSLRLGEGVGGRFQVVDGLSEGDLVVIRGNERLQPGQPITYPGAPTAAAPAPAAG